MPAGWIFFCFCVLFIYGVSSSTVCDLRTMPNPSSLSVCRARHVAPRQIDEFSQVAPSFDGSWPSEEVFFLVHEELEWLAWMNQHPDTRPSLQRSELAPPEGVMISSSSYDCSLWTTEEQESVWVCLACELVPDLEHEVGTRAPDCPYNDPPNGTYTCSTGILRITFTSTASWSGTLVGVEVEMVYGGWTTVENTIIQSDGSFTATGVGATFFHVDVTATQIDMDMDVRLWLLEGTSMQALDISLVSDQELRLEGGWFDCAGGEFSIRHYDAPSFPSSLKNSYAQFQSMYVESILDIYLTAWSVDNVTLEGDELLWRTSGVRVTNSHFLNISNATIVGMDATVPSYWMGSNNRMTGTTLTVISHHDLVDPPIDLFYFNGQWTLVNSTALFDIQSNQALLSNNFVFDPDSRSTMEIRLTTMGTGYGVKWSTSTWIQTSVNITMLASSQPALGMIFEGGAYHNSSIDVHLAETGVFQDQVVGIQINVAQAQDIQFTVTGAPHSTREVNPIWWKGGMLTDSSMTINVDASQTMAGSTGLRVTNTGSITLPWTDDNIHIQWTCMAPCTGLEASLVSLSWENVNVISVVEAVDGENAQGVAFHNMPNFSWMSSTLSSTVDCPTRSCIGVAIQQVQWECGDLSIQVEATGGGGTGMEWGPGANTIVPPSKTLFLDAEGPSVGIKVTSSQVEDQVSRVTWQGRGADAGLILEDTLLHITRFSVNAEGLVGMEWSNVQTFYPTTGATVRWEFQVDSTDGENGVGFLTHSSFILLPADQSSFRLYGSPAQTSGTVSIAWDSIRIEPTWRMDEFLLDSPFATLTSIQSEGSISLQSSEGIRLGPADGLLQATNNVTVNCLVEYEDGEVYTESWGPLLISAGDHVLLGADVKGFDHLTVQANTMTVDSNAHLQAHSSITLSLDTLKGLTAWQLSAPSIDMDDMDVIPPEFPLTITGRLFTQDYTRFSSPLQIIGDGNEYQINGLARSILWEGGIVLGHGQIVLLTVPATVGTTQILRPSAFDSSPLEIQTLVGDPEYHIQVLGNACSRVVLVNRTSPLPCKFQVAGDEPWGEQLLFPLGMPSSLFHLEDPGGALIAHGDVLSSISPTARATYYNDTSLRGFVIRVNTPPQAMDQEGRFDCPCVDPTVLYCVPVLFSDTDPDTVDEPLLQVEVSTSGWLVNTAKEVCYGGVPDPMSPVVSTPYTLSDPLSQSSALVTIYFNYPSHSPSPAPSDTMSTSRSAGETVSPSPSMQGVSLSASLSPSMQGISLSASPVVVPSPGSVTPRTSVAVPSRSVSASRSPPSLSPSSWPSSSLLPSSSSSSWVRPTVLPSVSAVPSPVVVVLSIAPTPAPAPSRISHPTTQISCTNEDLPDQCQPCGDELLCFRLGEVEELRVQRGAEERVFLDLLRYDGEVVGRVGVPSEVVDDPNDDVLLRIHTYAWDQAQKASHSFRLSSMVSDVTLISSTRGEIHQLNHDLTLCLQPHTPDEDHCLGFYEEHTGRWRCQDECLQKDATFRCGQTDHLTSFALLLGGNQKTGCDSSLDPVIMWLSVAFIGGALCIVICSVVFIECFIRLKKWRHHRFVRSLSLSTQ